MKKNTYSIIISSILFFTFSVSHSSCNSSKKTELALLETLDQKIEESESLLDIDYTLFARRINHIRDIQNQFKTKFEDSMSLELGNNLDKLKAIEKVYNSTAQKGPEAQIEAQQLKKQISDFRNSVRKISKKKFKEYYSIEKIDVEVLLATATEVNLNLYRMEGDYVRLENYFESYLSLWDKERE
jgi:hypothetical protein